MVLPANGRSEGRPFSFQPEWSAGAPYTDFEPECKLARRERTACRWDGCIFRSWLVRHVAL